MPRATKLDKIRGMVHSRKPLPHLSELAEHFIDVSGGPRAVANILHQELNDAPKGGIVRTRILALLAQVWKYASTTEGKLDNLGLLNEGDLERLLEERLRRLVSSGEENPTTGDQPG